MMTILTVLHVIAVCALALWLIHEILENAKLRVKNAKMRAALETIGGVSNQTCESVDTLAVLSREFIKIAREALEANK
jgi:hypothetical protein